MWGDMDPYKWTILDWIVFLLQVLVPTAIVVAWIVMMVYK